ncbi:PadR family transcriptional regulator [Conexibacter arvalis]|uniref:DNA-binding PadR family transcriptional regulator n=1 Tax=Conexibacter arvalis TaxID=912552 RepID=A0A840IBW8_9ACTN|nr:PadR family transcriptional regulator [Conexibacter arvalis]MBB4662326.1 DNA-binding PadR family transcriptional regulator [Conexibacter arvalis]
MKFAVLGLLIERRGYGYDLANRLQERLGPGFRAAFGAVYVSLDQLAKEQFVAESRRVQVGRQVKVYYEATEAGVQRFSRWMRESVGREPVRGELYLKLAVARDEDLGTLRDELHRLEHEALTELERCGQALGSEEDGEELRWEEAARWLADAAVVERLQADLRWLRIALRALEWAAATGAVPRAELRRVDALASA